MLNFLFYKNDNTRLSFNFFLNLFMAVCSTCNSLVLTTIFCKVISDTVILNMSFISLEIFSKR